MLIYKIETIIPIFDNCFEESANESEYLLRFHDVKQ